MNENHTPDLDDIILSYLKAVDSGESPDPDAWLARHPQFADDLRPFFACERRLGKVGTVPTSVAMGDTPALDDSAVTAPEHPVNAGRFELGPELGHGGIGTVLRARDPVLDRPLAVKLLQHRHRRQPQVATRFLAEARIAAGLQHPGVPPIHDIGEATDGRPFIAMKLIEGRTLAELLRERPSLSHDLPRFLKVFEQVAQTVAYAHSRGVLHRDLKPHNVMSGAFGEVQVMDWGLAKHLAESDACTGVAERERQPQGGLDIQAGATRTGTVIGTPAYMAPEQARGEVDRLDARADVFGLGAILCEILTGQPPFATRRPLEQSRDGDLGDTFARLDSSGCDAELIALAKRCLAPDPTQRPVNGQAVAEAMTAYLTGVQERLRHVELASAREAEARKRRRTVSILVALALLSAVAGLGVFLSAQARANADLAAKNAELARANDRERQRFALALEAIGLFHGEVIGEAGPNPLLMGNLFSGLRGKLIRHAVDFYGKLEAELQDQQDSASQVALGRAYQQLGGLLSTVGNNSDALVAHRKALAIQRRLAAELEAQGDRKLDLARTLLTMGWLQDNTRDIHASETLAEARVIVEQLELEVDPSDESQAVLAQVHHLLGAILWHAGRVAEAEAEYERARAILQSLADAHPEDLEIRRSLGGIHIQLGVAADGIPETKAHFLQALAHFKACVAADPSNPFDQYQVAHCHAALAGMIDAEEVSLPDALADAEAALTITSRLTAEYPTVVEFQRVLALASGHAGKLHRFSDQPAEARAFFERALTIWMQLGENNPDDSRWQTKIAGIVMYIADLDREAGWLDAAFAGYEKALAIQEEVLQATRSDWDQAFLAYCHRRLGLAELAAGRTDKAAAATRQARDLLTPVWEDLYASPQLRFELACCHGTLAGLAALPGSGVPSADASTEAEQAMAMLRQALRGYRPYPVTLLREPGLDPLRGRDDFNKLFPELQDQADPRGE